MTRIRLTLTDTLFAVVAGMGVRKMYFLNQTLIKGGNDFLEIMAGRGDGLTHDSQEKIEGGISILILYSVLLCPLDETSPLFDCCIFNNKDFFHFITILNL